eukprot:217234-Rhodomonas_salina.1
MAKSGMTSGHAGFGQSVMKRLHLSVLRWSCAGFASCGGQRACVCVCVGGGCAGGPRFRRPGT